VAGISTSQALILARYVLLWKRTRTKTHTASLLAKPTPLSIDLGSDRFSLFNTKRDIVATPQISG
jgi:hypothetical protein